MAVFRRRLCCYTAREPFAVLLSPVVRLKSAFPVAVLVIRIASAWCRKNRSSCWRKRKADEYERHENQARG